MNEYEINRLAESISDFIIISENCDSEENITPILVTNEIEKSNFTKDYFGDIAYKDGEKIILGMIKDYFDFHITNKKEYEFYKLLEKGACTGYYISYNPDPDNFTVMHSNDEPNISFPPNVVSIAVNLRTLECMTFLKHDSRFTKLYKTLFKFASQHPKSKMIFEALRILNSY